MTTKTNKLRNRRTRKTMGGKTFSQTKPVEIKYNNTYVVCDLCKHKEFTENTGSFGKSKVRSTAAQVFLGDLAETIDTTSVIIYTCNECGLCKIIRNKDPLKIIAIPVKDGRQSLMTSV
jgi:hypothetical protein